MALSPEIQQRITLLAGTIRAGLGSADADSPAHALLSAMEDGRITFEREPWFALSAGTPSSLPAELLLRAYDKNAAPLKFGAAVDEIYQNGLYAVFDAAIALAAIDQALSEKAFPVSINISSRNAADYDALTGLHKMLQSHFGDRVSPDQVIFELLEDDRAENPSAPAMDYMTAMGYRFALDDITDSDFDAARLKNIGPYASFIKIDGKVLTGAQDRSFDRLEEIVRHSRQAAPQARILCEWVDSPKQADRIRMVHPRIELVQGRNLGQDSREFTSGLDHAEHYGAHRYGPFMPGS